MPWDDRQYLKFADERNRAAEELLARVPLSSPSSVLDLGCGPGNSTALLRRRWPEASLVGVDSSSEMLDRARQDLPGVEWVQADIRGFRPRAAADVLFANALFQWVPDHEVVFPELLEHLRPGGVLAVQMPFNAEEPSHRLMREVPGPWSERIAGVRAKARVSPPAFYYDLLGPRATSVDLWRTTYEHVMPDARAIVEFVKGTALRPFLDVLSDSEKSSYLRLYEQAIDEAYPARTDGKRLFSFPRLFVVAVR